MCQITFETIDQWATILSPIISAIAVVVALIAIYCNSKDTNKKIAEMEKNTSDQIESIKKLAKLQAEIASSQLGKELWETHFRLHKISGKQGPILKDNRETRQNLDDVNLEEMNEKEKADFLEKRYLDEQLHNLEGQIKNLERIKEEMGLIFVKWED